MPDVRSTCRSDLRCRAGCGRASIRLQSVDISGWRLINTRTWSAPVPLSIIPAGTTIAPRSHYLLGLANSGLVAPAAAGATTVNLRSTADLSPGTEIIIGGERRTVKSAGTAATAPTKVFINVSTGPLARFPNGHDESTSAQRRLVCDARREATSTAFDGLTNA